MCMGYIHMHSRLEQLPAAAVDAVVRAYSSFSGLFLFDLLSSGQAQKHAARDLFLSKMWWLYRNICVFIAIAMYVFCATIVRIAFLKFSIHITISARYRV